MIQCCYFDTPFAWDLFRMTTPLLNPFLQKGIYFISNEKVVAPYGVFELAHEHDEIKHGTPLKPNLGNGEFQSAWGQLGSLW